MTQGIHHSVVLVQDLDQSVRFYRDGLGLELLVDRESKGDWPTLLEAPSTGRAGRTGQGTTLVLPDQQADVSRVANLLGHREQFESGGMKSAHKRLLYTSRCGRRSRW